jgi:hypothetical protein
MIRYWCVDFGTDNVLTHGIEIDSWMMQYQYADEHNNLFEADRPTQIVKNWRRLGQVQEGDRFAAYLPRNRFYATGTVIKPTRANTSKDHPDTIESYLKRKQSHRYKTGFVRYTPVFYENFSDPWRDPNDILNRWPQRIDVEEWKHYVPDGVVVKGLNKIPPYELQLAVFEIGKDLYDEIEGNLMAASVDDSVVEAIERHQARGQGFQLDSRVRKALEDYAMDAAKRYFEAKRYEYDDTSKTRPYDLICRRGSDVLYVEVKGTQTDGVEVVLTRGEVEFARIHQGQMVLFILHSIELTRRNGDIQLSGGKRRLIRPWNVDSGELQPLSFKCRLS